MNEHCHTQNAIFKKDHLKQSLTGVSEVCLKQYSHNFGRLAKFESIFNSEMAKLVAPPISQELWYAIFLLLSLCYILEDLLGPWY